MFHADSKMGHVKTTQITLDFLSCSNHSLQHGVVVTPERAHLNCNPIQKPQIIWRIQENSPFPVTL